MKLWLSVVLALAIVAAFSLPVMAGEGKDAAMKKTSVDYFAKMDTDADGKVSQDEWMQKYGEKFQKMDADGDGFVTKEEKEAYSAKKMGNWKKKSGSCMTKKSSSCTK